jgi:hypothetical protein
VFDVEQWASNRFGEVKGEEDVLLKEMLLVFRLSRKLSSTF